MSHFGQHIDTSMGLSWGDASHLVYHILVFFGEDLGLALCHFSEDSEDAAANQGDNEMPLELGIKS
eukprot:714264-Amphidinium_carterae.2